MIKKIILSFFIIFLLLTFFVLTSYATETQDSNSIESDTTFSNDDSSENNVTYKPQSSNVDSSYVTSVTPVSTQYEANLGLNNILSILLISIGILLILLGVAILIKLKR